MKAIIPIFCLVLAACTTGDDTAARLKADLTAGPSATQVLTDWCGRLKLADPPAIRALRDAADKPAGAAVRALLKVGPDEPLRYRRVRLACGGHVLSEADNWYVPARLTPAMNRTLDTSDTPFGTVVKGLNFHRRTLDMTVGDMTAGDMTAGRDARILVVRALLLTPDQTPFSLVVENYTRELAVSGQRP